MVVCKCRKATRLYCFVHKVPVCGECICFPEHQICVVKKYSDWVVDGEYDWPPVCSLCHAAVEAGSEPQTTRLGCLHIIHTDCLVSHIRSFPPQTAPAGYACPECSTPIWPPKSIKDTGSRLHSKLKEAVILKVLKESDWEDFHNTLQSKSGSEKNVFGNHLVSLPSVESQVTPPAFASGPLVHISGTEGRENNNASGFSPVKDPSLPSSSVATEEKYPIEAYSSTIGMNSSRSTDSEIVEIDGASSIRNQFMSDQDPNSMKSTSPVGPGATTRKGSYHYDRQNSEISYYADDEDGTHRKYTRRGPFYHKFLRLLLPFWSSRLPTLPVTAPPRKDGAPKDDVSDGRLRHQRSSRMDPRKILLIMAIMACMATMGILYYRLAQRSLGENTTEDEPQ